MEESEREARLRGREGGAGEQENGGERTRGWERAQVKLSEDDGTEEGRARGGEGKGEG